MGNSRAALLGVLVILTMAISGSATFWPLHHDVHSLKNLRGLLDLYSVGNSNADVFLTTIVYSLLLVILLSVTSKPRKRAFSSALVLPAYDKVRFRQKRCSTTPDHSVSVSSSPLSAI
jgi:hypothetical protein